MYLNIGKNNIENNGVKSLSAGIENLTNMTYLNLNLRGNNIENIGLISLSNGFRNLT